MALIEEVANYIVAQSTVFAIAPGTSTAVPLWLGRIGENSADTSVGIYETGGAAPVYTYNGISHERPGLQIISRSTSYTTAKNNASLIWTVLAGVANDQITKSGSTLTTNYITITPNQSPFEIGEDDERRQLFSCNYFLEKELS